MKLHLLFILVILNFTPAFAQSGRFLPGQITLASGETKTGYIERTHSERITYEVNFKEEKEEGL
jgi:hypothetical protein